MSLTAAAGGPPSEPLNLMAEPGDRQVTLTWDPPSNLRGFDIERYEFWVYRTDGSGAWTSTGLSRRATLTGLTNGRRYGFDVRAVNERGEGPRVTIAATPGSAPSAPRDLKAEPGDSQVMLAWQPPAYNGGFPITGYEYRVDGGGAWISTELVRQVTVTDPINGQTGLTNGEPYGFEVRAVNKCKGEDECKGTAATVTATPATKPPAPGNLQAVPDDRLVSLTWEEPADDGGSPILRYEYRVDGTEDWTPVGTSLKATVIAGLLVNGMLHTFAVRAVNKCKGEDEDECEGIAATVDATPVGPPSAPLMLGAMPDDGTVTLTWQEPETNGGADIERYEYRVDGMGDWTSVRLDSGDDPPRVGPDQRSAVRLRGAGSERTRRRHRGDGDRHAGHDAVGALHAGANAGRP